MKIPNADRAVVEIVKLSDYCFNPDHPRGKHKAKVFRSACGFTAENADVARQQLLESAARDEAVLAASDMHGRRYVIECVLTGPSGSARVRAAWIVRSGEDFPRFVSAYVM